MSKDKYSDLEKISFKKCFSNDKIIYYLGKLDPKKSKDTFSISCPTLMNLDEETLDVIRTKKFTEAIDSKIIKKINDRKIKFINTNKNNWKENIGFKLPKKWKINVVALGDVGSTLALGLKLLGKDYIEKIGVYDLSENNSLRWEKELNQVVFPFEEGKLPKVEAIEYDNLFNCDMFVFCATKGVPSLGTKAKDVRMIQFEENSRIIDEYAKQARNKNFKGFFAVVSDPVDLLCKKAFISSNTNKDGLLDLKGISPEKIKGYGLGVMNARATYYAEKNQNTKSYHKEGRVFGPHGEGLVVANSINNYDSDLSEYLTERTIKANLEIRELGYKPYIAPALSSGAISILNTISQKWHYSANFIGGVYMGTNNRNLDSGLEIEKLNLPDELFEKIEKTYQMLKEII